MTELGNNAKAGLVTALNGALADTVALYFKTKNFHWHVAGPRFRDLHLLFDEQAAQLISTVDNIGERVRKNDEYTLTSIHTVTLPCCPGRLLGLRSRLGGPVRASNAMMGRPAVPCAT